jgi:methionyl-tRNA formyltransferase
LRVLFAGTPEFAARCLATLLESRHEVSSVMTRPDRPSGRGLAPSLSPVKKLAVDRGIRVLQPETLKHPDVRKELELLRPEAIVTAAFGLILPQAVLDIPPRGAINVHASLLPRWRGAAPVQRALLAGDLETGITIMRMEAGLDTGPVLLQVRTPISNSDTAGTLSERLADLGGRLVVRALDALEAGELEAVSQAASGVTYAPKLDKRESLLDWREDAAMVDRRVRAFSPSPGAAARVRSVELKIWACTLAAGKGNPGEVLGADGRGLCVACGTGALLLTELQRPGGRRLPAAEFLRGFPLSAGDRFETPIA